MNISKRNSVERPNSKHQFQQNWIPHPHIHNVLYHRLSKKHIQAHILNVPQHQVQQQKTLIDGRINNKHPFVCCAHFYHSIPSHIPIHLNNSNTLNSFVVYTDRIMPLQARDWTHLNICNGIIGLKRLIMIYGPVKVTEQHFGKNENGEIKVWISVNPQKNRPDFPLFNQHQTISCLIQSIKHKNPSVFNSLSGCLSLRQAIEKLSKRGIPAKIKHRYTPSIGMYLPTQPPLRPNSEYPQNFNQFSDFRIRASRQKSYSQHLLFNSLWKSKDKIQSKSKNKMKGEPQNILPNRSISFFNHHQPKVIALDSIHQLSSNRFSGPTNFINSPTNKFKLYPSTPQSRLNNNNSSFGKQYFFSHRGGQPSWREHAESHFPKQSYDITIINNNVSNFISNFQKNQSAPPQSAERVFTEDGKTPYFAWNTRKNSPNNDKKRRGVPSFISNKQGLNTQSLQNSNQGTRVLIKDNKPLDKSLNFQSQGKDSTQAPVNIKRRKQPKFFTFCSNEKTQVPETSNYLTAKVREPKERQIDTLQQNIKRIMQKSNHPSSKIKSRSKEDKRTSLDDFNEYFENGSNFNKQKDRIVEKSNLKQMLKKQYNHLLDFEQEDCIEQEGHSTLINKSNSDSEEKKSLMKESLLKDKIKQKKQAFAQLKKEALKVLTDF